MGTTPTKEASVDTLPSLEEGEATGISHIPENGGTLTGN